MAKLTKEEKKAAKAAKRAEKKAAGKGVIAEFKAFISRGNVLDMSVGVIMGGAFSAIVTAFTNILLALATWGVPGGLKGLITVLPAAPGNALQRGVEGIGQKFAVADYNDMVAKMAINLGLCADESGYDAASMFLPASNALNSKYTLHGGTYVFNGAAFLDWGSLITAVISFLIIALSLFIIVKIVSSLKAAREKLKAQQLEKYYEKHPEERPVPAEPGAPVPTELDILVEIRDLLKKDGKVAE